MQGMQVQSLVEELTPTCHGATKPAHHIYWAHTLESKATHQTEDPRHTTETPNVPQPRPRRAKWINKVYKNKSKKTYGRQDGNTGIRIDTEICGNPIHLWSVSSLQECQDNPTGKKNNLYNKWWWENWIFTCKRISLDPYLTPCTKINSKWIKDQTVKSKIIKQRTKHRHKSSWQWFKIWHLGSSLVIQGLVHGAFTAVAPVQSLVRELKPCKPQGRAK